MPKHPTYREVIGRNIRRLRTEKIDEARGKPWTQARLGEEIGVYADPWSKQTVSHLEAGRRPLDVDELVALAVALEVPVAAILMPHDEGGHPMADDDRITFPSGKPMKMFDVFRVLAPQSDPSALRDVYDLQQALQRVVARAPLTVTPDLPPATVEKEKP